MRQQIRDFVGLALLQGEYKQGAVCRYVKYSENIGIKCYVSEEMAYSTWEKQKYAARFKLAPKLGLNMYVMHGHYCYFTQHAQPISECPLYRQQYIDFLTAELNKIFSTVSPMCKFDMGCIDGKPVAIDFSHHQL